MKFLDWSYFHGFTRQHEKYLVNLRIFDEQMVILEENKSGIKLDQEPKLFSDGTTGKSLHPPHVILDKHPHGWWAWLSRSSYLDRLGQEHVVFGCTQILVKHSCHVVVWASWAYLRPNISSLFWELGSLMKYLQYFIILNHLRPLEIRSTVGHSVCICPLHLHSSEPGDRPLQRSTLRRMAFWQVMVGNFRNF